MQQACPTKETLSNVHQKKLRSFKGKQSSELVFQVIADSYEHKSLILTTNLPFSEWGKIVADEQLAAAMIDRIVHFGHLIDTGKVDWRLRLSPMNHQMVEKKIN